MMLRRVLLALAFALFLASSSSSQAVDIKSRQNVDDIDPQSETIFSTITLIIGVLGQQNVPFNNTGESTISYVQLSVKVRDIPGDGFITHYSFQSIDSTHPIKFGVLKVDEDNSEQFTMDCVLHVEAAAREDDQFVLLPLPEPCKVSFGDRLFVGFPEDNYRASLYEEPVKSLNIPMPFNEILDGVEVNASDFTFELEHDLSVAFSAIFDAGTCHQHVIGAELADRPYNSDREDIIYVDYGHPIVGVTYLRGVALYVRDARDATAIVRVVAQVDDQDDEAQEVDICNPLAFFSVQHSGIVRKDYDEPCVIPEDITAYLRLDTLSRATDAPRNLLSYSHASTESDFTCRLVVNSRPQLMCDRVYSLQAITSENHCYSNVIPKVEEMQNEASVITTQAFEPEILFDFRQPILNMELNETCSEALHGPIKYLDKAHPLKAGIVKEVRYHYSSLPSTDTFFAVVWRYDDRARLAVNSDEVDDEEYYEKNEEYYVHCLTLATPPQIGETQGSAWMPNGCVAKDGDYLGFIYTGTAPIPISYTHLGEVDSDSKLHLSVIDDNDYKNLVILPISDNGLEASYTFGNSVGNLEFNITALQCTVKYETTMNEQTQLDDIPYDLYVGNALYTRNETGNDALIVVDLLNAVAVDGYVTSFHIDPNYHSSSITTLMMVRPIIEQDHQETEDLMMDPTPRMSGAEIVCSLNITPSSTEVYELDEPCRVERGDRLAISSLGSESSLSFDLIDGYPCEFLDQTFSVIDNHECHRMYSMGYSFSKIQISGKHLFEDTTLITMEHFYIMI
ncbi:MAG: hypothetical protein MHMPM18_000831 [Marteilia pararefringens]